LDHRADVFFSTCREILVRVHFADNIHERTAGGPDRTQIARSHLPQAVKLFSIKVKAFVGKCFWQKSRGSFYRPECQILFPNIDWLTCYQCRNPLDRVGMPYDYLRRRTELGTLKIRFPIEAGSNLSEIRRLPRVIRLSDIGRIFACRMRLSDL